MSKTLQNKVVVVTGGARSIGFEIAVHFLKNGASKVIILDVIEEVGKKAAADLTKEYSDKIDFIKCDVTQDLEKVSNIIFDKYKTVDVLVNNAGIVDEFDVKKTISINTIAVLEWSFKFCEHMRIDKGGKGGTILNVASAYGFRSDPYLPIYKASKHAVMGFTKTLGHENNFNRYGVRVVAICPGYTKTSLSILEKPSLPDEKTVEEYVKFLKSPTTLWQTAEDVGKASVEVFERADSGTAWLIEGGKPLERVF
ncbi:short chain dehydrogenase domain-containing protein [Phthorimaea operculella]|nr:short chain dehydrogenase domain-containing protein [Phthorimaea operculella]